MVAHVFFTVVCAIAVSLSRCGAAVAESTSSRSVAEDDLHSIRSYVVGSTPTSVPAEFKITFESNWAADDDDDEAHDAHATTDDRNANASSCARWSPPLFVSHGSGYHLWAERQERASEDGSELSIVEIGSAVQQPKNENYHRNDLVLGVVQGSALRAAAAPGDREEVSGTLCVDGVHPYISGIATIAPSPDCFSDVLLHDFVPADDLGYWYDSISVALYPWDTGRTGNKEPSSFPVSDSPDHEPRRDHVVVAAAGSDDDPSSSVVVAPKRGRGINDPAVAYVNIERYPTSRSCAATDEAVGVTTSTDRTVEKNAGDDFFRELVEDVSPARDNIFQVRAITREERIALRAERKAERLARKEARKAERIAEQAENAAESAARQAEREADRAAQRAEQQARKDARIAEREDRKADRVAQRDAQQAEQEARKADRVAQREANQAEQEARKDAREAEREAEKAAREAEKEAKEAQRVAQREANKAEQLARKNARIADREARRENRQD